MQVKRQTVESESDEELVRKVAAGRVQIYGQLVERYQRQIYNLMYRYCRSASEAAEMSQDVFFRAYERLASFDSQRSFFPWLYTIAVNRAKDWQRRNSRELKKLAGLKWEIPSLEIRSYQEKNLESKEETERMYAALDNLPDTNREIILLRYRQEMSIRDLSSIFDLSESAVKMRISRSLEQIKFDLGGARDEE